MQDFLECSPMLLCFEVLSKDSQLVDKYYLWRTQAQQYVKNDI